MEVIQIFIFGTGFMILAVFGAVDEVGMHTFVQIEQRHFSDHSTHFMSNMLGVGRQPHLPQPRRRVMKISLVPAPTPPGSLKSLKRALNGYILLNYHFHLGIELI